MAAGLYPISKTSQKELREDMRPLRFMGHIGATLLIGAFASGCVTNQSNMGTSASGSATLTGSDSGAASPTEANFARQACQAGATQAEIGKLAALNTKNETVRTFAKSLVKEHTQQEKELGQIFAAKHIPAESELAEQFQSSIDHLAELKGGAFDRAFRQQVIDDHEKAIVAYEKQATRGTDPELRAFAQKHLPHLREHLELAKQLPISTDTEGPAVNSVNTVLQNPAPRTLVRP
jgi:putative membrane protein